MSKMRLYVRRLTILGAIFLLIWLIVVLTSNVEVLKVYNKKNVMADMAIRIEMLRKRLNEESLESNKLLMTVKSLSRSAELAKNNNNVLDNNIANNIEASSLVLPVLVIACDRITVKRCLDNLIQFRPNKETFPIIVSQDCGHNATYQIIKSYTDADPSISVVQQPDLSDIKVAKNLVKFKGYYKIARHFKFALNHVFRTLGHEGVIIVEDDLDISPDFFEYFLGTYPLLLKDPTLWCISAWNDNGKKEVINMEQPHLLHRTDFFPGLGWTLRRETWDLLEPKWPLAFFDDWLREPENTGGRACIRPEISRTYSFGKIGVSKGLFFDMHLRHMQLNLQYVPFTTLNLTYLLKNNYDEELIRTAYSAPEMSAGAVMALAAATKPTTPVRVPYTHGKSFQRAAKKLGLMDDFRSGIPRTAYLGIVSCFINGRRVYLTPRTKWTKYNKTWA